MSNTNTEIVTTAYEKLQKALIQADTVLPGLEEAIEKGNLDNYATTSDLEEKANKSDIGSPLTASTAAEMTDTSKVYVYVGSETGYTSGNWYSYNGTAWVSGGIYNSQGIGDKTITPRKFSESILADNLFDITNVTKGKAITINASNVPVEIDSTTWNLTGYIKGVEANTEYKFKVFDFTDYTTGYRIIVYEYNSEGNYLRSSTLTTMTQGSFSSDNCKVFTTGDNCAKIRIQYYATLDSCTKFYLDTTANFKNEYTDMYVMPYAKKTDIAGLAKKTDIPDVTGLASETYVDNAVGSISTSSFATKSYVDTAVESVSGGGTDGLVNKIYTNSFNNIEDTMACYMNSLRYDKESSTYRTLMAASDDVFSHDSMMQIDSNGIAYVVFVANKVDQQDNPNSTDAFVRLNILDLNNLTTSTTSTRLVVAQCGDTCSDGTTLIKGTGVPNITLMNNKLYIMFSSKCSDGQWYVFRRVYDIATSTFGDIEKCSFTKDGTTYDFTTTNVKTNLCTDITNTDTFISMNAQISKSGDYYYCGTTVDKQVKNSLIFRTQDFLTFEFWLEPTFSNPSNAVFEGACYCKGSYLYYALRQVIPSTSVNITYMIIAKINLSTKVITDEIIIRDTSSRSCFFEDASGNLYLMHSTENRQRVEFLKLNTTHLKDSAIVMQGSQQGIYPSVHKYGDYYYLSSTGNSCTAVYVRRFSLCPYTKDAVSTKFIEVLGITV